MVCTICNISEKKPCTPHLIFFYHFYKSHFTYKIENSSLCVMKYTINTTHFTDSKNHIVKYNWILELHTYPVYLQNKKLHRTHFLSLIKVKFCHIINMKKYSMVFLSVYICSSQKLQPIWNVAQYIIRGLNINTTK